MYYKLPHPRSYLRSWLCASLAFIAFLICLPAQGQSIDRVQPKNCKTPFEQWRQSDLEKYLNAGGVTSQFHTPVLADNGEAPMRIAHPYPANGRVRLLVGFQWMGEDGVWEALTMNHLISAAPEGANATKISVRVPNSDALFYKIGRFIVVACGADEEHPELVSSKDVKVSNFGPVLAATLILVALAYTGLAVVVSLSRRGESLPVQNKITALKRFDPVYLTQGYLGRGSLSKLQILFFTFIVGGMLTFILLRIQMLSNLSTDVLLLLGVAGAGTAGAKLTAVSKNRLGFENWSWIIERGWITVVQGKKMGPPEWSDLIIDNGALDIYKFQMLVFSFIVGIALLTTGLSGLASFEIPDALLGVLGLSQVVYVGGKAIAPPSFHELDVALERLREAELAFTKKAANSLSELDPNDAKALEECKAEASEEYEIFREERRSCRRMTMAAFNLRSLPPEVPPELPDLPRRSATFPPANDQPGAAADDSGDRNRKPDTPPG